ncbi:sensor histidine kinase [Actinoplanes auranticolor]|uniref:Anti-sigma regulatory factor n=1 Tax=Actinoplanes auranticolor TaxID=47988 RepID=A0A919SKG0_9ACTN|nr:sensor histidine kinase [Actinoplanes auranticolor]GIM73311.1 anti-sigma regulatory factor [Actinoplanes auranticolor]
MPLPATLTHDAMFYGSDDEFAAALAPFAREGLERDEALVAAVTPGNIALLRDALGADATAVTFIDRDEWYRRPATTVAGWQRLLTEALARGHKRMRLIGEVAFGARPHHPTWTRYEAALNDVFAQAPAWIVCPYDTRKLPPALLDDARRTHPATFPWRSPSAGYLTPEQFLRSVPEPMPPVSGPPALSMDVTGGVASARTAVSTLLAAAGWAGLDRGDDLILAMCEIVTNSIRHGHGRRELRVWTHDGTVTCEVTDDGHGMADPLIGYRPPAQDLAGGRGVWIAQQLCDALSIVRRDAATVVRFAVTVREPLRLPTG